MVYSTTVSNRERPSSLSTIFSPSCKNFALAAPSLITTAHSTHKARIVKLSSKCGKPTLLVSKQASKQLTLKGVVCQCRLHGFTVENVVRLMQTAQQANEN